MITRNFNLYLNAGHSVPLVINVNQYDSGEQWVFTLYNSDGTKYTPSTGAIVGIKSDGLGIINSGSVVDGNVVINETQQMTAAVGKAVFELTIDSGTHGTANFVVLVEEKPGNNADLSDSDLSLIQEALDAVNPLPTGGSVGQVLTKTENGSAWTDAGTPTQEQVADAVSDWADEHITVSTGVVIDTSLAVAGAAADSKKVGDEITDLKSAIRSIGGGLTADIKQALMDCINYVAWKNNDPNASQYINALQSALYPPLNLRSISAVYTQTSSVYEGDSLDVLRSDLVVTAEYSDYSTETVTTYVLTGTLTEGTSTITATYGGKTATFTVAVSPSPYEYIVQNYVNPSGATNQTFTVNNIDFSNGDYVEWSLSNVLTNSLSTGDSAIRLGDNLNGNGIFTYNSGHKYIIYTKPNIGINQMTAIVDNDSDGKETYTASTTPANTDNLIVRADKDGLLINGNRFSSNLAKFATLQEWMNEQTSLVVGLIANSTVTFNYILVYRNGD